MAIHRKGPKAKHSRRSAKHDATLPGRPRKISTAPSGYVGDVTIPTAVNATDFTPEVHQNIAPGKAFIGGFAGDGYLPGYLDFAGAEDMSGEQIDASEGI